MACRAEVLKVGERFGTRRKHGALVVLVEASTALLASASSAAMALSKTVPLAMSLAGERGCGQRDGGGNEQAAVGDGQGRGDIGPGQGRDGESFPARVTGAERDATAFASGHTSEAHHAARVVDAVVAEVDALGRTNPLAHRAADACLLRTA